MGCKERWCHERESGRGERKRPLELLGRNVAHSLKEIGLGQGRLDVGVFRIEYLDVHLNVASGHELLVLELERNRRICARPLPTPPSRNEFRIDMQRESQATRLRNWRLLRGMAFAIRSQTAYHCPPPTQLLTRAQAVSKFAWTSPHRMGLTLLNRIRPSHPTDATTFETRRCEPTTPDAACVRTFQAAASH